MTTPRPMLIDADTPEDIRKFVVRHLREQCSMRRRQATLARTKTDKRSHERLAENLETIAAQLDAAVILRTLPHD